MLLCGGNKGTEWLARGSFRKDPFFGLAIPEHVADVPVEVLDPRQSWEDKSAYDRMARDLVASFEKNFRAFEAGVGEDIRAVALRAAA